MRCNKKSTTFCVHPCQPLLSQKAASSRSLRHLLCPFLFLPLKQPEGGWIELAFLSCQNRHGRATWSAQGSQRAALTARCPPVSSHLSPLPALLGREGGRQRGRRGQLPTHPPFHPAESGCQLGSGIWNGTTAV